MYCHNIRDSLLFLHYEFIEVYIFFLLFSKTSFSSFSVFWICSVVWIWYWFFRTYNICIIIAFIGAICDFVLTWWKLFINSGRKTRIWRDFEVFQKIAFVKRKWNCQKMEEFKKRNQSKKLVKDNLRKLHFTISVAITIVLRLWKQRKIQTSSKTFVSKNHRGGWKNPYIYYKHLLELILPVIITWNRKHSSK